MVYNEQATLSHPLSRKFSENLNKLSIKDGGKGLFKKDAIAISLDKVEKSKKIDQQQETMDIAIGIIKKGTEDKPKNKRLLMCEFKFRVTNPGKISTRKIENKINNSRSMLQKGYLEGSIHPVNYILFQDHMAGQGRRAISSRLKNKKNNIQVCSESDLKNLLFPHKQK